MMLDTVGGYDSSTACDQMCFRHVNASAICFVVLCRRNWGSSTLLKRSPQSLCPYKFLNKYSS